MGERVEDLVRDLTARLATIAQEFADRIEKVPPPQAGSADADVTLEARAQRVLNERRRRGKFLPPELFHEPAWDMMLALFIAHGERRTVNVGTLVTYSDAPVTTSQRWIEHLHRLGQINRVGDPVDRRRIEISLTDRGLSAMVGFLQSI